MLALFVLVVVMQAPPVHRVPLTPHAAKPLQLGVPCLKDSTCGAGLLCAPEPNAAPSCHLRCGEGCSETQRCTVLAPPDDERRPVTARRFVCTDSKDTLCQTCASDDDCGLFLDKCIAQLNGELACGRDCAWDDQCPRGYVCADPGDANGSLARRQCVPKAGCCHCDVGYEAQREDLATSGGGTNEELPSMPSFSFPAPTPAPQPSSSPPPPWWSNPNLSGWLRPFSNSRPTTPSATPAPAMTPTPAPTPARSTVNREAPPRLPSNPRPRQVD